jgi:hypothetical protein
MKIKLQLSLCNKHFKFLCRFLLSLAESLTLSAGSRPPVACALPKLLTETPGQSPFNIHMQVLQGQIKQFNLGSKFLLVDCWNSLLELLAGFTACSLETISQISQPVSSVFLSKKPTSSTFSQPDQAKRTWLFQLSMRHALAERTWKMKINSFFFHSSFVRAVWFASPNHPWT